MNFIILVLILFSQNTVRTFRGVSYLEGSTWIVDYDTFDLNNIYFSPDNGYTWFPCGVQFSGHYPLLFDIEFINDTLGWTVGGQEPSPGAVIFKSTDGCGSWTNKLYGVTKWFSKVHFVDENIVWFGGGNGFYGKTLNGGDSIFTYPIPELTFTDIYGVAAFDAERVLMATGFVGDTLGGQGYIILSKDGGNHWTFLDSSDVYDYFDLFFINLDKGWCVGGMDDTPYEPVVKITENGGTTWTEVIPPNAYTLRSVQFINEYEGWVCGKFGTVLHTTDGGYTWEEQSSGTKATLFALEFYDSLHGVIVGDSGVILFTEDGGQTWDLRPVSVKENDSRIPFDEIVVKALHEKNIEIFIEGNDPYRINLYDVTGRRIKKELLTSRGYHTIKVEKGGIYFLEALKRQSRKIYKIVIIK